MNRKVKYSYLLSDNEDVVKNIEQYWEYEKLSHKKCG
jgi:hypothetical protein